MAARRLLLMDANVLIDYADSDLDILTLASRHLGRIYVLDDVLAEVEQLSPSGCQRAAIEILEAETEQLIQAGSERASLSFRDRLCLIVAKDLELELVTNDKVLRRHCDREQVGVVWGLALMLGLLKDRHLSLERALRIARMIHEANPLHIGKRVLDEFVRKARGVTDRW